MKSRSKKIGLWVVGILAVLILGLQLILEPVVLRYVNDAMADMGEYKGRVKDVDIALLRGAYRIDSLSIEKVSGEFPEPFVNIDALDISIEWKALFHGAVVGEIILENPVLNFTRDESGDTQAGEDVDWLATIQNLIPISINRFEIKNGHVFYRDIGSDPKVEIEAKDMYALATNLSTVQDKNKKLPSHINMTANITGDGNVEAHMDLNALKPTPDFDMDVSVKNMDLTSISDFTEAYANFDFKQGNLDVFAEAAMDDGNYEGYVKPLMKQVKVIDLKNKEKSFWRKTWEVVVGTTLELFENQKNDQFATKVPFEGSTDESNVAILKSVGNVLKNAFIKAFDDQVDHSINIRNLTQNKKDK